MSGSYTPFIEISPITKLKTVTYTKMLVTVKDVMVGQNTASILVSLYSDAQDELREFTYTLTQDEYKQWGDDTYIIQYVKNRLKMETF